MSYWSVGLPQDSGDPPSNMEQRSSPAEEMGAKASLVGGPGPGPALVLSPTLDNIQAAYKDGEGEAARELIQQACCVDCSVGMPHISGVRLLCVATQHGDLQSVCYLLKEARIPVPQELSKSNPAILAAYYGHVRLVKELLDSIPGSRTSLWDHSMSFHQMPPT